MRRDGVWNGGQPHIYKPHYHHLHQMSPILWPLTLPVGERESKYSARTASSSVRAGQTAGKKVSPAEQTWCTPNISSRLGQRSPPITGKRGFYKGSLS